MSTSQYSIKYRPYSYDEFMGQDKVKQEIVNRSKSGNWPQAILLRGLYGTGKTTLAQLISMSINCINIQKNGDPCGECESCKSIKNEEYYRDVQVLNGNEVGGKDNVSNFLSDVGVLPRDDKKKIYIIEEADGLSSAAKSSLLKTIEKKYSKNHVHFILLSMVSDGIPSAIRSRCQEWNLKSATVKDILYMSKNILVKEGIWDSVPDEFKKNVLVSIANASAGSMRTAVQYLERAIVGQYFTADTVFENLGLVDEAKMNTILLKILTADYSVFEDLKKMDPIEFYSLSAYNLACIVKYSKTGLLDYDFLENQYKTILEQVRFNSLVKYYDEVLFNKTRPFIRMSELVISLANYMSGGYFEMREEPQPNVRNIRKIGS